MKTFKGRVIVPGTCTAEALVSHGGFNTLASYQMALQFGDKKVKCGDQSNPDIYKKMGVIGERFGALGILTITPSEGSIIGADVATKAADVQIVFLDRFNGSLVIGGDVSSVEAAVKDVLRVLGELMGFVPTAITRT